MSNRPLKCCGGFVENDQGHHEDNCPSIVRAALSWIEESSIGERHRRRGLAAFEAIVSERDSLRAAVAAREEGADTR